MTMILLYIITHHADTTSRSIFAIFAVPSISETCERERRLGPARVMCDALCMYQKECVSGAMRGVEQLGKLQVGLRWWWW